MMKAAVYGTSFRVYALLQEPDFEDGESVPALPYEAYSEANRMENTQIHSTGTEYQ